MSLHRLTSPRGRRTATVALIGGLVSIPLTLAMNWHPAATTEFSASAVVVGGLVAGALARFDDADAVLAGLGAGVVGGVPGLVWILPATLSTAGDFAAALSFEPAIVAFAAAFGAAVVGVQAVAGLVGGLLGGWLVGLLGRRRAAAGS